MQIDVYVAAQWSPRGAWCVRSVNTRQRRIRMRDPNRIDRFLETLGEAWKRVPDWRFFQMMCNIQRAMGSDAFYVEDEDAECFIKEMFQ